MERQQITLNNIKTGLTKKNQQLNWQTKQIKREKWFNYVAKPLNENSQKDKIGLNKRPKNSEHQKVNICTYKYSGHHEGDWYSSVTSFLRPEPCYPRRHQCHTKYSCQCNFSVIQSAFSLQHKYQLYAYVLYINTQKIFMIIIFLYSSHQLKLTELIN